MADDIKRLNYFTGQFLDAQDFRDEQTYHKEMRWRGNRLLFGPGVSIGLEVTKTADNKAVVLSPGVAVDDQGRELVILPPPTGAQPPVRPVPSGLTGVVKVVISYADALTDSHSVGGYTGATRVTETPRVDIQATPTSAQIVLAALQLDANGAIQSVDTSARQSSPIWLDAGHTIQGKGRLHIDGPELLYLLNRNGVIVGKEWGGNGNLSVQGQLNANGDVVIGTGHDAENRRMVLRGPNSPTGPASSQDVSYEFAAAGSAKVRAYRGGGWGTFLQLLTNSPARGADQPEVRVHVDESGDVGIGTTQPKNPLHVEGTLGIRQNELHLSGGIGGSSLSYNAHRNKQNNGWVFPDPTRTAVTFEIDDGGGSGKARFDVFTTMIGSDINRTNWVHRLRIDGETGNVGVGTPAPEARLSVVSTGASQITGVAQSPTLRTSAGTLGNTTGAELALASIGFLSGNNTSFGIRARRFANGNGWTTAAIGIGMDVDNTIRAGGAALWLHPAGTVGIGTSEPQANLHVKGDGGVLNLEGSSHAFMQWFPKGVAAGKKAWMGFGDANDANNGALTIRNDAGRMHIYGEELLYLLNKNGVRVGKEWGGSGTLNVAGLLTAESDASVRGVLAVQGSVQASAGVSVTGAISASGGIIANTISYSGIQNKLDVGEGDPIARIRAHDLWLGHSSRLGRLGLALVDGTTQVQPSFGGPLVTVPCLIINFNRDWNAVKIEGTFQSPSSRKLKENIRELSSDVAGRIVSALEPVSFSHKRDATKSQCLGFIAEDCPPEVASGDGEAIVVNHIVAALTRVVKDQQRMIETLEARLSLLESKSQPA